MGLGTTIAIVLVIIIVIIGGFGLALMGMYNSFVSGEQNVNQKWSLVETQYERRADLVPNLVATVKGAANFEKSTLTAVIEARQGWAQAQQSGSPVKEVAAANTLDSAISRLLVTVEAYPTLTATQSYRDLITELEGTENRISFARGEYNTAVQSYNTSIKSFPGVMIAGMFGFTAKEFYNAKPGAENVPNVDFNVGVI